MKDDEIEKVTLNLAKGDMAKMRELFPEIGASAAIRKLVRTFITNTEAGAKVPKAEVQI